MDEKTPIIKVRNLSNYLGDHWVHQNLDMTIYKNETYAIVGASGAGKTTILRNIIKLLKPTSGDIEVLGVDMLNAQAKDTTNIRRRWGILFQQAALFSSMTVLENVMFPLHEFTSLSKKLCTELAKLKIGLAGLPMKAANKLPGELSGGMKKRAALARAIALDPEILFLDEPTSGLDPKGSEAIDDLIIQLSRSLDLTTVLVTHDLDTMWCVADRVGFLGDKKMLAELPMKELVKNPHPLIQEYFSGKRGSVRNKYYEE